MAGWNNILFGKGVSIEKKYFLFRKCRIEETHGYNCMLVSIRHDFICTKVCRFAPWEHKNDSYQEN
jgi:hypothetical protein